MTPPTTLITDYRAMLAPFIAALGQAETARRSGVAQPQISRWLQGKAELPLEDQLAIAVAHGFRVRLTVTPPRKAPARSGR